MAENCFDIAMYGRLHRPCIFEFPALFLARCFFKVRVRFLTHFFLPEGTQGKVGLVVPEDLVSLALSNDLTSTTSNKQAGRVSLFLQEQSK